MDSTTLEKNLRDQTAKVYALRAALNTVKGLDATESLIEEIGRATDRLEQLHQWHDAALVREAEGRTCLICQEHGADSPVDQVCQTCYERLAPWALQCRYQDDVLDPTGFAPEPWDCIGDITALHRESDLQGWGPYTARWTGIGPRGETLHWMVEE